MNQLGIGNKSVLLFCFVLPFFFFEGENKNYLLYK